MIIKPAYTTESIEEQHIDAFDQIILEDLVSRYGSDIVVQSINEAQYYGTGGSFDRTGGSRVSGVSGFLKSIPSFAITAAVCWPVALIAGLGAITHRIRENFEDKNSWLNTLDPRFWVDYLATPHKSKSSSSSSSGKEKEGWVKRLSKTILGGAAGAGAATGIAALMKDSSTSKDSSINQEEAKSIAMNAIFVPYWVTLSNGEILRVRSDSAENAKIMANTIIAYTTKPCYNVLNAKIAQGCPKYKFYFDDGEMCYWSAETRSKAYKEAVKTRKELCQVMNTVMPSSVVLDDLDNPKVSGKVEIIRGEKIDVPQQNKFLSVTTVQPKRPDEPSIKKLPNPIYKYGSLSQYRVVYANFSINVPVYKEGEAIDIAKDFNSRTASDIIRDIYYNMDKHYDLYSVHMKDGDIYVIPGKSVNEVSNVAINLYNAKVESIKSVLQDSALEEYNDFLKDFGEIINSVRNVRLIDPSEGKDYTIKKGDEASLVKITEKEEKNKRYPNFRL